MNDKKLLDIAKKKIDDIIYMRIVSKGHKFNVNDPKKFKYWIKMCDVSEKDAAATGFIPSVYLSKVVLK